jgi:hypothetical protein
MRKVIARLSRAAIVATTVTAAACSGLMAVNTASAAARNASPGGLGGWAPFGHGRTIRGPWGSDWRNGSPLPPPTLNGDWAPFNRCPVDDPTMLAADGEKNIALCVAVSSPSGEIKIGGLALPTGENNTQFGLVGENHEESETTYKLVSPRGGAGSVAPIEIPNGLPALVCPGASHELWWLCGRHRGLHADSRLTDITATVQQAGELSNFNLIGALSVGAPIVSMPAKIHLENVLLGPGCYIGSDNEPIVLQLENLTSFTSTAFETFEGDGNTVTEGGALIRIGLLGATDGDESFAVPGVSGCGFRGTLDDVIDHNAGLPSPAGDNALVLNETSTYLTGLTSPGAVVPNDGKDLSQYWHSAVQGGSHGYWHH